MFSHAWLHRMDFLNIPVMLWMRTQPPAIRHPGSLRAFRAIHVPKLLGLERNIKKISYDFARHFENILRNLPDKVNKYTFFLNYAKLFLDHRFSHCSLYFQNAVEQYRQNHFSNCLLFFYNNIFFCIDCYLINIL